MRERLGLTVPEDRDHEGLVLQVSRTLGLALLALLLVAFALLAREIFVSIAAVVALTVVSAISPAAVLVAIPAVIGFVYHPIWFGGLEFSPQETMIVAATLGAGAKLALQVARHPRLASPVSLRGEIRALVSGYGTIAALWLVAGLISLVTLARPEFRHESLRQFRWVILEPLIYFVLARWFLRERAARLLAAALFVAGSIVVALAALGDLATGTGLSVEGVLRISGLYPHPNALALYIERPFVFASVLAFAYQRSADWRWLIPAGLTGVVLLATFSRGAVLAAGFCVVAGLLLGRRVRLAAFASALGGVLVAALAIGARDRIVNLFGGGSGSLRLSIWHSAIDMIRDHPIFGIGPDQFLYVYAPRYIRPEAWPERFTSHPHDIILDLWLSLGIMGVVVAAGYAVVFVRDIRRAVYGRAGIGLAAAAAIATGTLHGLVDNGYFLPDLALMFWFLSALLEMETAGDGAGRASLRS